MFLQLLLVKPCLDLVPVALLLPVIPLLLQSRIGAPLDHLLIEHVIFVLNLQGLHCFVLFDEMVEINLRFLVLADDRLTFLKLFELSKIICNRVHRLFTELSEPVACFDHFDDIVLQAPLLDVPHELQVLATAYENVTIVPGHHPVMETPGPFTADLSDAQDVSRVVDGLHTWTGDIGVMVEKVNLPGDNNRSLILIKEEKCVLLDRAQSNFA